MLCNYTFHTYAHAHLRRFTFDWITLTCALATQQLADWSQRSASDTRIHWSNGSEKRPILSSLATMWPRRGVFETSGQTIVDSLSRCTASMPSRAESAIRCLQPTSHRRWSAPWESPSVWHRARISPNSRLTMSSLLVEFCVNTLSVYRSTTPQLLHTYLTFIVKRWPTSLRQLF